MIKRCLFSLLSIILMMFLITGCRNNKNEITLSTGAEPSSISNTQASPASTASTSVEDKAHSATPVESVKETQGSEIKSEVPVKDNNEKTAVEVKKEDTAKKISTKKVIVIDPGHGGKSSSEKEPNSPDSTVMKAKNVSGATGAWTKTPEHVIALEVANALKAQLSSAGFTVIMTRNTSSETISNIERAEIGNKNNADLAVRIHADSSDNSSAKGASMLVPGEVGYAKDISKVSRKYGEIIFNTLLSEVGMKSRGIVTRNDLTGFNWSKVPVVLIEMGFLSNQEEDKLLSSEQYQKKIAEGLFKGIKKALGD